MTYFHGLVAASLLFLLLERALPAREQRVLRDGWAKDLFYLFFNGHFYALVFGGVVAAFAARTRESLAALSLLPEHGLLDGAPFALAFVVYLVVSDFLQWCVHNLLHRLPILWTFHQVHHSITTMDWAGNFRFHWVELVVYRSLLYVPLLFLGGAPEALLAAWVLATAWGHFNHANVRLRLGPLGCVLNSPAMHLWHHDKSSEGGAFKNYGVVLSLWDFLFGTAYWPRARAPRRLGYPGMERLPDDLARQLVWPLLPEDAA